ncbi:MAG: hypothetical protein AAF570_28780, partial [Bacteroidota bacterium]
DTAQVQNSQQHTVNGLPCVTTDLFGALTSGEEPLEVYYRLCVLESPTHFYQLIAWSPRADYPQFSDIAGNIECSFRELPPIDSVGTEFAPGDAAETAGS